MNAIQLQNELSKLYENIKAGAIQTKEAKEMNNVARNMIQLAKANMEYATLRGEKPEVKFLDK